MRAALSGQNGPGGDGMNGKDREDAEYVASSTECTGLVPALREDDGADRALYGTDFPMWSPVGELARFDRLDLTDDERERILWTNTQRLFPE